MVELCWPRGGTRGPCEGRVLSVLRRIPALAGFLAAALILPDDGAAQAKKSTVVATIVDQETGEPLEGAILVLSGIEEAVRSDREGKATIVAPVGRYTLTVSRSGYITVEGGFRIHRDGDFRVGMERVASGSQGGTNLLVRLFDAQSGKPLEGAEVRVADLSAGRTDEKGRAMFAGLASRVAQVEIEMLGYLSRSERVRLVAGETSVMDATLAADPVHLEPIVVSVRSKFLERNGVYRRMDSPAKGVFLTRKELEASGGFRFSDALRQLPGIRIRRGGVGGIRSTVFSSRDARCPMQVWVDGVEWNADIEGSVDIDQIPAEWIEVAEVYTGHRVPQAFRGMNGCGAILIWTRQKG